MRVSFRKHLSRISLFHLATFLVACFFILFIATFTSNNTVSAFQWVGTGNASGSLSGGTHLHGTGCNSDTNRWKIDCAGVSWAYYKATSTTTDPTEFPYLPGSEGLVVGDRIPGQCSENGGGFWHLGVNAINAGYSNVTTRGVQGPQYNSSIALSSSNSLLFYGHWMTTSWYYATKKHSVYEIPSTTNSSKAQYVGVYKFTKYGSGEQVLNDYNKVLEANGQSPVSSLPDGIWGFCYSANMDSFHSVSNARAGEGLDHYKSTNIKNKQTSVTTDPLEIQVGEQTSLVFSHGIYTKAQTNKTTEWGMRRFVLVNGEEKDGFSWTGHGDYYQTSNASWGNYQGQANFTAQYNSYYAPQSQIDNNNAITRDSFNIVFKIPATYDFCEEIRIPDSSSYMTKACARIVVTDASQLYTKSNVSNDPSTGDKEFKSTGFLNYPQTEWTDEPVKIPVNGTSSITFSHNLYSSIRLENQNVNFQVRRTVNVSQSQNNGTKQGISTNTQYEILSTAPPQGNSSGSGAYTDDGIIIEFINKKGNDPYFIGGPRDYDDGNTDYDYALRDFYKIQFKQEGVYDFCETIYVENKEYTTVCSKVIVGDVTPPPDGECADLSGFTTTTGETSVASAVKNTSISTYNSWREEVYAKPNDDIRWLHCYYSGVQSKADTEVTRTHVQSSHPKSLSAGVYKNDNTSISNLLGSGWQNQYTINTKKGSTNTIFPTSQMKSSSRTITSTTGEVNTLKFSDQYNIRYRKNSSGKSDTGDTLTESIKSGKPSSMSFTTVESNKKWTCDPHQVEYDCATEEEPDKTCTKTEYTEDACSHGNDYITYSGQNSTVSDQASVKVPYNFNIGNVNVNLGSSVVFAGETIKITNMSLDINKKQNSTLNGNYATKVDDAKLRLIAFVSNTSNPTVDTTHSGSSIGCSIIRNNNIVDGNCDTIAEATKTLNGLPENLNGKSNDTHLGGTYNVFDVDAGLNYCVVAAVYPSSSGADLQMNSSGNNQWAISSPKCVKVAKRPSLEIWGASLYSNGMIATTPATKRVVAGIYDFDSSSTDNRTVFGSWVEQAIVSKNNVNGIASGAATGNPSSNGNERTHNASLGGSWEGDSISFCNYRTPLTMPNDDCDDYTNSPGGEIEASTSDKSSLINMFKKDVDSNSADYAYVTDETSLDETTIPSLQYDDKTTVIIDTDGLFTINGNITYEQRTYATLAEIPKLIIHAKNIEIACDVTRVDAVLIADGTVNTCNNDNLDDDINSTPLKIFGTIIADKLIANRTYGSATGVNSTIPAEIIDYDTSLYLWGIPRANTDTSGKSETTYQTELAPRY